MVKLSKAALARSRRMYLDEESSDPLRVVIRVVDPTRNHVVAEFAARHKVDVERVSRVYRQRFRVPEELIFTGKPPKANATSEVSE